MDVFVEVVSVGCLRVGVEARDVGLVTGKDGLLVGVDDLAVDLDVGVEDLAGSVGLVEPMVGRDVGVEDLEGLVVVVEVGLDVAPGVDLDDDVGVGLVDVVLEIVLVEFATDLVDEPNVGLPDGVAGLPVGVTGLEAGPPEDEGLRSPVLEVFNPGDDTCCLDPKVFLPLASVWVFDSYSKQVNNIINSESMPN